MCTLAQGAFILPRPPVNFSRSVADVRRGELAVAAAGEEWRSMKREKPAVDQIGRLLGRPAPLPAAHATAHVHDGTIAGAGRASSVAQATRAQIALGLTLSCSSDFSSGVAARSVPWAFRGPATRAKGRPPVPRTVPMLAHNDNIDCACCPSPLISPKSPAVTTERVPGEGRSRRTPRYISPRPKSRFVSVKASLLSRSERGRPGGVGGQQHRRARRRAVAMLRASRACP